LGFPCTRSWVQYFGSTARIIHVSAPQVDRLADRATVRLGRPLGSRQPGRVGCRRPLADGGAWKGAHQTGLVQGARISTARIPLNPRLGGLSDHDDAVTSFLIVEELVCESSEQAFPVQPVRASGHFLFLGHHDQLQGRGRQIVVHGWWGHNLQSAQKPNGSPTMPERVGWQSKVGQAKFPPLYLRGERDQPRLPGSCQTQQDRTNLHTLLAPNLNVKTCTTIRSRRNSSHGRRVRFPATTGRERARCQLLHRFRDTTN